MYSTHILVTCAVTSVLHIYPSNLCSYSITGHPTWIPSPQLIHSFMHSCIIYPVAAVAHLPSARLSRTHTVSIPCGSGRLEGSLSAVVREGLLGGGIRRSRPALSGDWTRASCLLVRCSTTWAAPSVLLLLVCFTVGSYANVSGSLWPLRDPPLSSSWVACLQAHTAMPGQVLIFNIDFLLMEFSTAWILLIVVPKINFKTCLF
jgi:hypothetical protein